MGKISKNISTDSSNDCESSKGKKSSSNSISIYRILLYVRENNSDCGKAAAKAIAEVATAIATTVKCGLQFSALVNLVRSSTTLAGTSV